MSQYQPYPEYRKSKIEWLDKVPEHWTEAPICILASCNDDALPESTTPDTALRYVDISSVNHIDGIIKAEPMQFRDAPSRARRTAKAGDVVVSTVRTYLKAVAAVETNYADCVFSTGFAVLRPRENVILPEFLKWLTLNELLIQSIESHSEGLSYPAINATALVKLKTVLPDMPEQRTIAAFLDRETVRIDALIAKKTRFIELLKEKRQALITHAVTKGVNPEAEMKDSGVEWIGEVPKHWSVCKLSFHYSVQLGKMLDEKKATREHLVSYLRNQDVQWGGINTENLPQMDITPEEMERYSVKYGDLLVCEGGDVGRAAIWRGEDGIIGYQKALHRLRPVVAEENVAEFMLLVLMTAKASGAFQETDSKSTISHLPAEKFRTYRFPFPSSTEQREIVEQIDRATTKLDALVQKTQLSIDLLKEHRSALITAAVTGKIDLRETV